MRGLRVELFLAAEAGWDWAQAGLSVIAVMGSLYAQEKMVSFAGEGHYWAQGLLGGNAKKGHFWAGWEIKQAADKGHAWGQRELGLLNVLGYSYRGALSLDSYRLGKGREFASQGC